MITEETLQDKIYDWLISQFPTARIIWENPTATPAARPNLPYFSLLIKSLTPEGRDYKAQPNVNRIAAITGNRSFILSVSYSGQNALSVIESLLALLVKTETTDYFQLNIGGGFRECRGIFNLDTLREERWEHRATGDFVFVIASRIEFTKDVIEAVEVKGDIMNVKNEPKTVTIFEGEIYEEPEPEPEP